MRANISKSKTDDGTGLQRNGLVLNVIAEEREGGVGLTTYTSMKDACC